MSCVSYLREALLEGEDPHLQSNWDDGDGYYKPRIGELIGIKCTHSFSESTLHPYHLTHTIYILLPDVQIIFDDMI